METLKRIQKELKAPKGQHNSFGNYDYRSCEDILTAVKPLLGEATLILNDEIMLIGDRYYVKATATLNDGLLTVSATAYARESLEKKGMDTAQITGAASSYARKYALNGLFLIDDTKDADTVNGHEIEPVKAKSAPNKAAFSDPIEDHDADEVIKAEHLISEKQAKMLYARWKAKDLDDTFVKKYIREKYGVEHTRSIQKAWFEDILKWVEGQ